MGLSVIFRGSVTVSLAVCLPPLRRDVIAQRVGWVERNQPKTANTSLRFVPSIPLGISQI